jgi:hypothetical protein
MAGRGRRWGLVATVVAGLVGLATAGWVAFAAFAPLPPMPRERVYVIPKGTGARQAAGQSVSPIPSHIHLWIGIQDVLVLRNEDDVPQAFGPIQLRPGQTYRVPFQVPATFDFACSVHDDGQVSIVVERAPVSGWERLRWRLMRIGDR